MAGDIVVVGDGRAVYSAAVRAGQDDCRTILPRQVVRVVMTLYFIYFAATAGEAVGVPGLADKMFAGKMVVDAGGQPRIFTQKRAHDACGLWVQ